MFENLLYQDKVRDALKREITTGRLPPAIIFAGPPQSGKMTAALELARALNCKVSGAPWACHCSSCAQYRLLDSPYMLLMGRRNFSDEIQAAQNMLMREKKKELYYLFLRNVKKLVRRFDYLLWQDDNRKLNMAIKFMDRLNELIGDPKKLNADLMSRSEEIISSDLVRSIDQLLPADGVGINMLRRAVYWARTADRSLNKTIIIENADSMNNSARNSLLKVLEEAPPQTFFILTTERPGAIVPTIRSRARFFRFLSRKPEELREVISRVYRCSEAERYNTIQDFFDGILRWHIDRKHVELMFVLLRKKSIAARDTLAAYFRSDRQNLRRLIILCLEKLRTALSGAEGNFENIHELFIMQRKLEEMYYRCETYNIPVASILECGYR